MNTVKGSVKETFVGIVHEPDHLVSVRSQFEKFAPSSEEDGERYMTEDDFVEAIAPPNENYVRCSPSLCSIVYNSLT